MKTKLTVTIEEETVQKAKLYAKQTERSLSGLIENYLKTLVEEHPNPQPISSKLKRLVGVVKLPPDFDEKTELNNLRNKTLKA